MTTKRSQVVMRLAVRASRAGQDEDSCWEVNSTGKVQIEAKDELRSRIGRSPDRADAAAMAFADFTPRTTTAREGVKG